MTPVNIQKMAASFGLLSFGILSIGSVLMGATFFTGIFRGIGGAIFFGLLAWGVSSMLLKEEEEDSVEEEDQEEDKGTQLDQTA
ncbi:MAG: hypothetical protein ACI9UO_001881 [Nitrospinales bacterium]|jgi:hypothetical protein